MALKKRFHLLFCPPSWNAEQPFDLKVFFALIGFIFLLQSTHIAQADSPALQHAKRYKTTDIPLEDYWVSEKLDGVRAYWDGRQLVSRRGNIYHAPPWFIAGLPKTPLDGELWAGRQQFETTLAIVRRIQPDDQQWRKITYQVFDLPHHTGTFTERLGVMESLVAKQNTPWLNVIPQYKVQTQAQLDAQLEAIVAQGGEGLMLHRGGALYQTGRSNDLLKLKPFDDAEAIVTAHHPGKGKYQGMMGSITVARDDGITFRIGTGFTVKQRKQPPAIGTRITYRYQGLTKRGVPRFARFLRERPVETTTPPP